MPGYGIRSLKWTYNRVKSRDFFRQSISLTFRGKENFSLWLGGGISILITSLLIVLGGILIARMFRKTDVQWNQNDKLSDLNTDTTIVNITTGDSLHFAFYLEPVNIWENLDDKPSFEKLLNFRIIQYKRLGGSLTTNVTYDVTKLDLENKYNGSLAKFDKIRKELETVNTVSQGNDGASYKIGIDLENYSVAGYSRNKEIYNSVTVSIISGYMAGHDYGLSIDKTLSILESSYYMTLMVFINLNNYEQ